MIVKMQSDGKWSQSPIFQLTINKMNIWGKKIIPKIDENGAPRFDPIR